MSECFSAARGRLLMARRIIEPGSGEGLLLYHVGEDAVPTRPISAHRVKRLRTVFYSP